MLVVQEQAFFVFIINGFGMVGLGTLCNNDAVKHTFIDILNGRFSLEAKQVRMIFNRCLGSSMFLVLMSMR